VTTLETCWRLKTPTGRTLTCALCRLETGVVVRTSFGKHQELISQPVSDVTIGRQIAARWLQALLDQGGFGEVAADAASEQVVDEDQPSAHEGSAKRSSAARSSRRG
jgi:hypothetical protein